MLLLLLSLLKALGKIISSISVLLLSLSISPSVAYVAAFYFALEFYLYRINNSLFYFIYVSISSLLRFVLIDWNSRIILIIGYYIENVCGTRKGYRHLVVHFCSPVAYPYVFILMRRNYIQYISSSRGSKLIYRDQRQNAATSVGVAMVEATEDGIALTAHGDQMAWLRDYSRSNRLLTKHMIDVRIGTIGIEKNIVIEIKDNFAYFS